jgi:hypothetical protein
MTKDEALKLIYAKRSAEWNNFRKRNPQWVPDLSGANLTTADLVPPELEPFDFSRANLCGTIFPAGPGQLIYRGKTIKLDGAIVDVETRFPFGYDPIKYGAQFMSKSEASSDGVLNIPTVFISYAWANEDVVLAIDQWLRLKGINARIDRRDFFAGSKIRDEILRIMSECNVVIIFYSKESNDKPWPEFEREMAADLEMAARQEKKKPPRIIYIVIDDTPLPGIIEKSRIGIFAQGKRFELVCEEIYHNILQLPRTAGEIDLNKWRDYIF